MHNQDSPCDRNNCRCGNSDGNCMYYNDDKYGHYNVVAVQGTGSPEKSQYRCNYNKYDKFNENEAYADHALGGMGTANQLPGYGEVNMSGGYGPITYPTTAVLGTGHCGANGNGNGNGVVARATGPIVDAAGNIVDAAGNVVGKVVGVAGDVAGGVVDVASDVTGLNTTMLAIGAAVAYLAFVGKLTDPTNLSQQDMMVLAALAAAVFFLNQE